MSGYAQIYTGTYTGNGATNTNFLTVNNGFKGWLVFIQNDEEETTFGAINTNTSYKDKPIYASSNYSGNLAFNNNSCIVIYNGGISYAVGASSNMSSGYSQDSLDVTFNSTSTVFKAYGSTGSQNSFNGSSWKYHYVIIG